MEEGQAKNISATVIPIVAIVGRPNVGKSTLFNRLCRDRRAIVDDTPGITRDRLIAQVSWGERSFCLVDTGGIEEKEGQPLLKMQVRQQAQMAVEEADLVLFLADELRVLLRLVIAQMFSLVMVHYTIMQAKRAIDAAGTLTGSRKRGILWRSFTSRSEGCIAQRR